MVQANYRGRAWRPGDGAWFSADVGPPEDPRGNKGMKVLGVAVAALALIGLGAAQMSGQAPATSCAVEDRYVVRLAPGQGLPAGLAQAPVVVDLPELGARTVCLPARTISAGVVAAEAAGIPIERDPRVTIPPGEYPSQPAGREAVVLAAEPLEASQWWLSRIEARSDWPDWQGEGVTVAVIDTGVDCRHPDLAGSCETGADYVGEGQLHSHGTHVAGIVAAQLDLYGIAGTAPSAKIISYRVLGPDGAGSSSVVARGMLDAASRGVVLNLSLGTYEWTRDMADASSIAVGRGAVVIAAAGNGGTNAPNYPACMWGVVGVGATDRLDERAGFSNFGAECVDIAAPGEDILSSVVDQSGAFTHQAWNGTSMSAPQVAGAAALLLGAGTPPENVVRILTKFSDPGPAEMAGRILNARKALQHALDDPGPTETPVPSPTWIPTTDPYPGPGTGTPRATPLPPATARPPNTAAPTRTSTAVPTRTASPTATPTPTATVARTATRTATATQTLRPIPSLTPKPSATPCTLMVYSRVGNVNAYRPAYAPCLTPTATPRR